MTRDITALLYGIKENIRLIEAGDRSDSRLDEVRADFLEFMELAKLFLISERDSYYGYFLMNMLFRANVTSNCVAGIKLGEFPPVFEANPLLLCKFSLKEILYVICHEIDHVVLNHPAEMLKSNPEKDEQTFFEFNLAADAAVNDRIDFEIESEKRKFLTPPQGRVTSGTLKEKYSLPYITPMESYAYYFDLIHGKEPKQNGNNSGNGQSSMMQKKTEEDGTNQRSEGQENPVDEGHGNVVTAVNCDKISDHNWETDEDGEAVATAIRELVNSAVDMMSEESRGLMPAFFLSQVKKINTPPVISWQTILKKYVGTISANKRSTRTRLNHRQPDRFDLSGRMDEKVLKIVVALDTSGSVSDRMIAKILNEIFAILAKRKHEITVIECDACIQRVYQAKTPADIQTKVAGRGGTWFSPVIEYVNKDRYFRDALLIYFTDGYGERKIPKPRTYRNIWVVFNDVRNLSLEEPYGVVLKL